MVYSYFLIQKQCAQNMKKTDMLREAYLITVIEIHILWRIKRNDKAHIFIFAAIN